MNILEYFKHNRMRKQKPLTNESWNLKPAILRVYVDNIRVVNAEIKREDAIKLINTYSILTDFSVKAENLNDDTYKSFEFVIHNMTIIISLNVYVLEAKEYE